jgi:YVTN family beta-propeller protein
MTSTRRLRYLMPIGVLLLAVPLTGAGSKVRIVQTNSAGDSVSLIDPATNKVVGEIKDIEVNHGAAAAPDGSHLYISNEAESSLDVVDAKTLKVTKRIPLSGHPNNLSISRDGRRVYVAIAQAPGAVDVVDTSSQTKVKSIPIEGAGHNTFVTPDGKFVVAGSVAGKTLTVIDGATEEKSWAMRFEGGVRPMTFDTNPDGSTRHIFVQISEFHGFAVVDFATHKELQRIRRQEEPHDARLAVARHWHHARWQDAVGHEQVVPLRGGVFDARLEIPRNGADGTRSRLADVHPRQQDGVRRLRRFGFRQRSGCQFA